MAEQAVTKNTPPPIASGFLGNLHFDALAGFLVFLIALPLCLAIARASNFPPIAGIWTAVVGGLVCTFVSNSQLTIKGPAAGLIVIVAGAVTELGHEFVPELPAAAVAKLRTEGKETEAAAKKELEHTRAVAGYRLTLGVAVAAGLIQILFGLFRTGKLGDFFPLPAVHGMLAAIGIIIIAKQSYLVLGIDAPKEASPLELLIALPGYAPGLNPEIACIGLVSLAILVIVPFFRWRYLRMIPAPMLVLLVAVPLGLYFDLDHTHTYLFPRGFFDPEHMDRYEVGPRFLVEIPHVLSDPWSAFAFPDFRSLITFTGVKYIVLFSLIGSLESLLSAKAIDLLDPWQRKTDLNRDLFGVGLSNTLVALFGGLPMISEIVRSSANINNGARTRWANFFHGIFLLAFVLLLPGLIHEIPLASLGAMLVYTGYRLASPREFWNTYKIGVPQFVVFVGTIVVTLATDLLIGIAAGILIKFIFHLWQGVPFRRLLRPRVDVKHEVDAASVIVVHDAAIFSTWLWVQSAVRKVALGSDVVVIDLSETCLVDHSVMEKLHELACELRRDGKRLEVIGLERHTPCSSHPHAARRRERTLA